VLKTKNTDNNSDIPDANHSFYINNFKPGDRLIKLPEVEKLTGLTKPTIYRLMNDPDATPPFPKNITIGKRSVSWIEREIYTYVNLCIAARNQKNIEPTQNGR